MLFLLTLISSVSLLNNLRSEQIRSQKDNRNKIQADQWNFIMNEIFQYVWQISWFNLRDNSTIYMVCFGISWAHYCQMDESRVAKISQKLPLCFLFDFQKYHQKWNAELIECWLSFQVFSQFDRLTLIWFINLLIQIHSVSFEL